MKGYVKPSMPSRNPKVVERVERLSEAGYSDRSIAKQIGLKEQTVRSVRRVHKLDPGLQTAHSAKAVAEMVGVNTYAVIGWCRSGMLRHRKMKAGSQTRVRITDDAVLDFLKDPATWHEWAVDDIPDPDLREWVQEFRTLRYLSIAQTAARMHVEVHTVGWWIRNGLLPGARTFASGRNWRIPESDLEGFRPPSEWDRRHIWRNHWTQEQDDLLLKRMEDIAAEIGRTPTACAQRHKQLTAAASRTK